MSKLGTCLKNVSWAVSSPSGAVSSSCGASAASLISKTVVTLVMKQGLVQSARAFASTNALQEARLQQLLLAEKSANHEVGFRLWNRKVIERAETKQHHLNRALSGGKGPMQYAIQSPGRWKYNRGARGAWGTLMINIHNGWMRGMR